MKLCKMLVFLCLVQLLVFVGGNRPLMCYLAAYAFHRPEAAKFVPELVDVNLCTHIIYAHLGISDLVEPALSYTDPYLDMSINGGVGLIERTTLLKKKNPSLKVLFSLGGWEVGSTKFSKIVKLKDLRTKFINNIVLVIKGHNFDGVDMNWMYPNHRGGVQEDVSNYVILLKELRIELKKHNFILVALMSGNEYIFKRAYDLAGMAAHLDYVLLLAYDFHGFWDGKIGVFAPLRYKDRLSVMSSVSQYLENGIPKDKILLGFGTHGRTFVAQQDFLEHPKNDKDEATESPAWSEEKGFVGENGTSAVEEYVRIGVPRNKLLLGLGTHGRTFVSNSNFNDVYFGVGTNSSFKTTWSKEEGFIGFNEICRDLTKSNEWTKNWDSYSATPFAVRGRQLISYDDEASFKIKLDYMKEQQLAGAFVWSLDTDDFRGDCYGTKFPLISKVKTELGNENVAIAPLPPTGSQEDTSDSENSNGPTFTIIDKEVINSEHNH